MIWGSLPLGLSCFLLWVIPPTNNQTLLIVYYTVIALIFYAAFTAVLLPYSALSAELTQDYDERTTLISIRSAFSIGGSIFSLVLAELIFSWVNNKQQQYLILGLLAGIIAVIAIYVSIWGTYKQYHQIEQNPDNYPQSLSLSLWQKLWAILPYFVINCMGLTKEHFTRMAITVQGTALIMMIVWNFLSNRLGKKAIYLMGIPFTIIAVIGLFLLQPGQVILMYIIAIMAGIGIATAYIVPWSMLPDVIDLDQLKTGERREGIFFALVVQLQKFGIALALLFVGKILDFAGYIPGSNGQQPDNALWAIRMIIGSFPVTLLIIGLIFAYVYPITRQVHQDILLQLYQTKNPHH